MIVPSALTWQRSQPPLFVLLLLIRLSQSQFLRPIAGNRNPFHPMDGSETITHSSLEP